MLLLHLPPETLKQIFDYVGSSFFQEDTTRLTVCKRWFEFARVACYQNVTFSLETLHAFMSSEILKRPGLFRDTIETLTLNLGVYQAPVHAAGPSRLARKDTLYSTIQHRSVRDSRNQTWRESLDKDLGNLATIIQPARRLYFLHIQTYGSPKPDPFDGPEDYLPLCSIQATLSVEHLKVLVLDLPGGVLTPSEDQEENCHICPTIGALLHKLHYLHLRMRSICPEVLNPQNSKENLHLRGVVINLSLKMDVPGITSAAHSKRCGPIGGGFLQLKADMQEQAEVLGARMASPKLIRILTHTLVQLEIQSLDVLNGKRMILEDNMQWDEDGKTVEEDSHTESDFSDESSTFFG
ncbi:hypothetical protein E4U35_007145 [Claviceps purpurea]|nr:hypothetical protein E4U35_007145 [Claviceps purpurea]KAG6227885.1 hypothetical protein E4U25_007744 [Claviceps purpurea]